MIRTITRLQPISLNNNFKQNLIHKSHFSTSFWNKVSPHPPKSALWFKDVAIVMTVFAVTGSGSLIVTRPILRSFFDEKASLKEGPWSYRLGYIFFGLPTYSLMLFAIGTLAGKRPFFTYMVMKTWSRFLPKSLKLKLNHLAQ